MGTPQPVPDRGRRSLAQVFDIQIQGCRESGERFFGRLAGAAFDLADVSGGHLDGCGQGFLRHGAVLAEHLQRRLAVQGASRHRGAGVRRCLFTLAK